MIELPQVTLVALTGLGYKTQEHLEALKKSYEHIEFGDVRLIQMGKIKDIDSWDHAVIYDLPKTIFTSHALLIHDDGYVINPDCWNPRWLDYDFLGAPWPLPTDDFSYRTPTGRLIRVGNSVSLRSKKLMDLAAQTPQDYFWSFKEKYGNTNEDGYICVHNREWLEEQGCKFADIDVAKHFSKEWEIEENKGIKTFAFHSTR